jgi:hypothetical protein
MTIPHAPDATPPRWRKSSYSGAGNILLPAGRGSGSDRGYCK